MKISKTEENYLKVIFSILEKGKPSASTNAISKKMQTSAASVTDMVKRLAKKKLAIHESHKGVKLTKRGGQIATMLLRKHRLWEVFLVDKLDFLWDEVHEIAEQLEHIHSTELIKRLDTFLGSPAFDPHGDPIPDEHGNFIKTEKKLLSQLNKSQSGVCVGVKESSPEYLQYLDKKKISIGTKINVLGKEFFDGSMVIEVGRDQFFVSKKIADNLYVQTT